MVGARVMATVMNVPSLNWSVCVNTTHVESHVRRVATNTISTGGDREHEPTMHLVKVRLCVGLFVWQFLRFLCFAVLQFVHLFLFCLCICLCVCVCARTRAIAQLVRESIILRSDYIRDLAGL